MQVRRSAVGTSRRGDNHAEMLVVEQRYHAAVYRVVAADMEAAEMPAHRDLVRSRRGDLPRRHQGVAVPGEVPSTSRRRDARGRLVFLQARTHAFDELGCVTPQ